MIGMLRRGRGNPERRLSIWPVDVTWPKKRGNKIKSPRNQLLTVASHWIMANCRFIEQLISPCCRRLSVRRHLNLRKPPQLQIELIGPSALLSFGRKMKSEIFFFLVFVKTLFFFSADSSPPPTRLWNGRYPMKRRTTSPHFSPSRSLNEDHCGGWGSAEEKWSRLAVRLEHPGKVWPLLCHCCSRFRLYSTKQVGCCWRCPCC